MHFLRTAFVIALSASSLAGASVAVAAETATDWCDRYVADYPMQGWDIQCIDPSNSGVNGWVSEQTKQVRIVRGMDQRTTQQTMGHELAHVESSWFPVEAKTWWANELGQNEWHSKDDYLRSPNEVWAENRSRCQGWHDGSTGAGFTVVDCAKVDEMLQRAKEGAARAAQAKQDLDTGASEEARSHLRVQVAWDEKTQRNWVWTWSWNSDQQKWEAVSYKPA